MTTARASEADVVVVHPTRTRLLDAGLILAETRALSTMPIDDIVGHAGVAKGTFYVHFADRKTFLAALHERFHDNLRSSMATRTKVGALGAERLRLMSEAYLDGCLRGSGVKTMLLGARGEPTIADLVVASNKRFADEATEDMRALGKPHPLEAAQLFVAMTAEVALLELDRGKASYPLREALWAYLAPQ